MSQIFEIIMRKRAVEQAPLVPKLVCCQATSCVDVVTPTHITTYIFCEGIHVQTLHGDLIDLGENRTRLLCRNTYSQAGVHLTLPT